MQTKTTYVIIDTNRDSEPKLYFFHAIHETDLEKIYQAREPGDKEAFLIAPSIGITKKQELIFKFGNITFLGDKQCVKGMKIYERDIWSPTLADVPSDLVEFKPSGFAKRIIFSNPRIRKMLKEAEAFQIYNPKNEAYLQLTNDQEAVDYLVEYAEKDPELRDKYRNKYYPEEIESYELIDAIVELSFPTITRTRLNISNWLKKANKSELRGQDDMAYAYAIAAKEVAFEDLEDIADKILIEDDSIDFEDLIHHQWQVIEELNMFPEIADINSMYLQEIAGNLIKDHSFEKFCRILEADYKIDLSQYNKLKIKALYNKLIKAIVNLPSEYLEAKTLDCVSINIFKQVVIEDIIFDRVRQYLIDIFKFKGKIWRESEFIAQNR